MQKVAIVTGAGGFIGSHLVDFLKAKNYFVYGIDLFRPKFKKTGADVFHILDLRNLDHCDKIFTEIKKKHQIDEIYMLAADMGGIGYIMSVRADLVRNNLQINLNSLELARKFKIKNIFFASSACVYPQEKQDDVNALALKENDALPANPDSFYGWEKLMTEQVCQAYYLDYGMNIHVARFHNIYGPQGTYDGGREKSPAAICRKIAKVKDGGTIEVWGDGKQERSYCYIDDCCEGIFNLMKTDFHQAINIGSDKSVTINQLIAMVGKIANKKFKKKYLQNEPQGVRSRNANLDLAKKVINWQVKTPLIKGMTKTYAWIDREIKKTLE